MLLNKDKDVISDMFNSIAPAYDTLNHTLSLGIDKLWRRKVSKDILKSGSKNIIDIATGTADLAIDIASYSRECQVTGVDFSVGMLKIGDTKVRAKSLNKRVTLVEGDALDLQFEDNSFDAATVGFGVRNFSDLNKGLREIKRVLKPGSNLYVIELSLPANPFIKTIYNIYFKSILPFIGKFKSKDKFAYTYLPQSVSQFLTREEFIKTLYDVGFTTCYYQLLTLGVATLYIAKK